MKGFLSLLCLGLLAAVAVGLPKPDESDSDGDAPPPIEDTASLSVENEVTPAPEANDDSDGDDNNSITNNNINGDDNNSITNNNTDGDDDNNSYDDDDDDDVSPNGNSSERWRNDTETDAPLEESGEALEFDALENLVYEFTNSTSGLNAADLVTRLRAVEKNIRRTLNKLELALEKDQAKITRLSNLQGLVKSLSEKLDEIDNGIADLTHGAENLRNEGSHSGAGFGRRFGSRHNSWATLYRSRGHSGRSTVLDFRTCGRFETCCKNFDDLDNDSQSIHTHDTCVKLFKDTNCQGESEEFYPGSRNNHQDFGNNNDAFSSGQPCSTT